MDSSNATDKHLRVMGPFTHFEISKLLKQELSILNCFVFPSDVVIFYMLLKKEILSFAVQHDSSQCRRHFCYSRRPFYLLYRGMNGDGLED